MNSTFTISHNALLARLATLKTGEISNSPEADEVLDVRDYVESFCKFVDEHMSEVFAEARYMAGVSVPKLVTPLQDFLKDQSIIDAFNSAAIEFPRQRAA